MAQAPTAHVPPQNIDAEESVLGAMLVFEPSITKVIDEVKLKPTDFYLDRHRVIFSAVYGLYEASKPVDELTVAESLTQHNQIEDAGGKNYVSELAAKVPAAGNAKHYAQIVQENALLRRLLEAGQQIQGWVHEREGEPRQLSDRAERLLFEVAHSEQASDFREIKEILSDEIDRLEKLSTGENELTGTPSGFRDLDAITGGFQQGNLVIIAARPAMGKSALVVNMAENISMKHGLPVAFFSLEMSEVELAQRFIACRSRIPGDRLRKGKVSQRDWPKVVRACGELETAPLWIDDSSDLGLLDLRAKARRLHAQEQSRGGLGAVIVDYMQLMRADDPRANRVEQVGQMSRGLKILARELGVPVIALSQLSRAPEQRPNKRPILSDLRESGCLAGDSRVFLPDTGGWELISNLEGKRDFRVLALNPKTWRMEPATVRAAFCTGTKPTRKVRTKLGRQINATGNHRFLTMAGWAHLDDLGCGDRIALPRSLPVSRERTMTFQELALLGHMIGDGCSLPRHAIQYTTREPELAKVVSELATGVFGRSIAPRIKPERSWYQVYLASSARLTHGRRNPVTTWLTELGVFGLRSHEKRVPDRVFTQDARGIAMFLRHLWSTDGCLWIGQNPRTMNIYYASSSARLAADVQSLLLRLGINSQICCFAQTGGRDQHHVVVSGKPDVLSFLDLVGALGERRSEMARRMIAAVGGKRHNPNRDVIPSMAWRQHALPSLAAAGITHRAFQASLDMSYCGHGLYKQNMSRDRAARVAKATGSEELGLLAGSDVYWDEIVSIEDGVEEPVFDLTVEGLHNFIANDIVVHNSIEQDADVVAFLYRDEYYNHDTDDEGVAEVIISKHRNGPIGTTKLAFIAQYPKFIDQAHQDRPIEQAAGEGPPMADIAEF